MVADSAVPCATFTRDEFIALRPDFIQGPLFRVTQTQEKRIVIVVDAVDEAGTPPGHNVLVLPEGLPQGVYVLLSQRPVAVALRTN